MPKSLNHKQKMENISKIQVSNQFPYLQDHDIQNLNLAVMYRILGLQKASDNEVELIKQKRRRLQKLRHKRKNVDMLKKNHEDVKALEVEKQRLEEMKLCLENEISHFRMCLLLIK